MLEDLDLAKQTLSEVKFNHTAWLAGRERAGLSQRGLGRLIGTAGANIHTIEKGVSLPSILVAMRFCVLLDIPMDELIIRPLPQPKKETRNDNKKRGRKTGGKPVAV